MIFNMVGGASGGVAVAYVTYPANSTLTCTNGSLTITDTNSTSSRKGFCVKFPTVGTWTIRTQNNSSDSVQKTIGVSSGQAYNVDLYYTDYIIHNGTLIGTALYNDSTRIKINTDYSGNPMTPPENTIQFSTSDWGGNHALVMFLLDVSGYNRIIYDTGSDTGAPLTPNSYPSSGVLSTSAWHQELASMTTVNYPPPASFVMTNSRAFLMFDRWQTIGSGRGRLTNRYYYLDVSELSGFRYITLGWTPFNGYRMNVQVKDLYGER